MTGSKLQRAGESLHRATPIPSLEPLGSRRASGNLSVSSIAEEDEAEDHDSATSLSERTAEKIALRQAAKAARLSPIPSGKAVGRRSNGSSGFTDDTAQTGRLLAGLKSLPRRSNNSGPPSPTVSDDSEGSGATFRSAESLHRPTPIPQDAAASYAAPGSFSRRGSSRAQPTTPTIDEAGGGFEEGEAAKVELPGLSLGEQGRKDSLHRPTPIPGDLLSSSGSLGRSVANRPATPTIREDEGQAERESDVDSIEHYYGAPQAQDDGGSVYTTPREGQAEPVSRKAYVGTAAHTATPPAPASLAVADAGQPVATSSAPASPGFSPFVESRDWERDILGVARFLRMCPGLSRQIIGDLLGENNERCLRVLECFTASFDFRGLTFEAALREYLEAFRLPGEAQKIYRILDTWSSQFFKQCPGIFKSADAVLVLAYALILLNTDLHNQQTKRKMTVEEFIGNNRGLNAGEDFPRDFLIELFKNIERRGIRITAAHPPEGASSRVSLPEPIRVTQERYNSPEKTRKSGFLCFP